MRTEIGGTVLDGKSTIVRPADLNGTASGPLFWKNILAREELTVPRKFFRYHSALELNVSHFFMNDI